MARQIGTLKMSSNFEPRVSAPFDARQKVFLKADLTAANTFPYPYEGMVVYCAEDKKIYKLIGEDPTIAGNWQEVGGDTIQVNELPTASADELGNIYEFVGTTTANYINGRFYRCVSDGASTPTYSWEEVDFGDGTPHWSGTRAEYEAIKNTLEAGTIVNITDDYDEGLEVVDVVEEDNMNPVTSNAVAEALAEGDVEKTFFTPTPSSGNVVAEDCWYIRKGNIVTVSIGIATISASEPGETVFTLPVGLRPCANRVICIGCNNNYVSNCNIQIKQNGNINVVCNTGCFGTATYVTE